MKLFIITGSSGVGKSTIMPFLKKYLPGNFEVRDFDEKLTKEIAMNGGLLDDWRIETTKYWINVARENLKLNKSIIVIGLIYPSEVRQLDVQIPHDFCLLDVSNEKIQERLMGKRFSSLEKIAGLKEATDQTPEEFISKNKYLVEKLRNEVKFVNGEIIDTTEDIPEQTANKILSWILRK